MKEEESKIWEKPISITPTGEGPGPISDVYWDREGWVAEAVKVLNDRQPKRFFTKCGHFGYDFYRDLIISQEKMGKTLLWHGRVVAGNSRDYTEYEIDAFYSRKSAKIQEILLAEPVRFQEENLGGESAVFWATEPEAEPAEIWQKKTVQQKIRIVLLAEFAGQYKGEELEDKINAIVKKMVSE